MARKDQSLFRVTYRDVTTDKFVVIKVRRISDSSLGPAFVEMSDFVFDADSLIVNPQEEEMKEHFSAVRRMHLAIYHIVSVEELGAGRSGLKLQRGKTNVVVLPHPSGPEKS